MQKIEELIDQALRSEPAFTLSNGFNERVLKAIRAKERKSQRRLYLIMTMGIVCMVAFGVGLLAYFQSLESLPSFKNIVPIAVLVGGVVALIQYLDNKLVKNKILNKQLS